MKRRVYKCLPPMRVQHQVKESTQGQLSVPDEVPLGVHCLFAQEADGMDHPGGRGKVEDLVAGGGGGGCRGGLGVAEDSQRSLHYSSHHCEHVRHKSSTLAQERQGELLSCICYCSLHCHHLML